MRTLYLFSSSLECDAAFPDGIPHEFVVRVTGVGIVDAAIGAARAISSVNPDEIIFIGTCGAHRTSGLSIGDVVYATSARLGSGDIARREMRIPSLMAVELACDTSFAERVLERASVDLHARPASVSCTIGITESDALATQLFEHDGSHVENLEAYALLRAAPDVPVAMILGVTNFVGTGGGSDWKANYRDAMHRIADALVRVDAFAAREQTVKS